MNEELIIDAELKYPDDELAGGVLSFSADDMRVLMERLCPELDSALVPYMLELVKRNGHIPTYGELKFYAEVLRLSTAQAKNCIVKGLRTDIPQLMRTYEDLSAKASLLYGKSYPVLSLQSIAEVSDNYMEMVDRGSDVPVSDTATTADSTLSISGGGLHITYGAYRETAPAQDTKLPAGLALAFLCPPKDASNKTESDLIAFMDDVRRESLLSATVFIDEFGPMGAICRLAKGASLIASYLSAEETELAPLLLNGYTGNLLLAFPQTFVIRLRVLAEQHSLSFLHFAYTTDTGKITVMNRKSTVSIGTFLSLKGMVKETVALARRSDTAEAPIYLPVETDRGTYEGEPLVLNEKLIAAKRLTLGKDSFTKALSCATDTVIELISAGADRRSIGFSYCLSVPADQTDEEAIGNGLSAILGIYRLSAELTAPTPLSSISYGGKESDLLFSAYGHLPKRRISQRFLCADSNVYFLPLPTDPEGFLDFEGLRGLCDEFTTACQRGEIRSAIGVSSSLKDALSKMSHDLTCTFNGDVDADGFLSGILFEADCAQRAKLIGRTAFFEKTDNLPKNTAEEQN